MPTAACGDLVFTTHFPGWRIRDIQTPCVGPVHSSMWVHESREDEGTKQGGRLRLLISCHHLDRKSVV